MTTHTVTSGETLAGIAREYGVTVEELVRWNDIADPDLVVAGQKLQVTGPVSADDDPSINPVTHVVAAGETLAGIAERYHVHLEDLARWNDIPDQDRISTGQELRIGPRGAQTYVVQPGDTVIGISQNLAVVWEDVAALNKLADPELIYPGQVLVVRADARLR